MSANIRLGLEAGECVRYSPNPRRRDLSTGFRSGAVCVAVAVATLVITAVVVERPRFIRGTATCRNPAENMAVQTSPDGIRQPRT